MSFNSHVASLFKRRKKTRPDRRRKKRFYSSFGAHPLEALEPKALLSGTVAAIQLGADTDNHALKIGSTENGLDFTITTNHAGSLTSLKLIDVMSDGTSDPIASLKIYRIDGCGSKTLVGTLSPETADKGTFDLVAPISVGVGTTEYLITELVKADAPSATPVLFIIPPDAGSATFKVGSTTLADNDGTQTTDVLLIGTNTVGTPNAEIDGDFQLTTDGQIKGASSTTLLGVLNDGAINTLGSFRITATPGVVINEQPFEFTICGGKVDVDTLASGNNSGLTQRGLYVTDDAGNILHGLQSHGIAHFQYDTSGVNTTVGGCGYVDLKLVGKVTITDCIAVEQVGLLATQTVWTSPDGVTFSGIDGYGFQYNNVVYGGIYIGVKRKR